MQHPSPQLFTTTFLSLSFPHSEPTPPPKAFFSPTCDMADRSASTRVRALFEFALQAYEKKTGITLTKHPLAVKLQSCHTVESITGLVQDQALAFGEFPGKDRIMKSIKSTVSILTTLSATACLGDAIGLVRWKGTGIDSMIRISNGFL